MHAHFRFGLSTAVSSILIVSSSTLLVFGQSGSRGSTSYPPRAGSGTSASAPASGSANRAEQTGVGLEGYCPVCLVEMRQWVKGDPRIAAEYDGRKYYFPGTEQSEMFNKDPGKYAPVLGGDDVVAYATTGNRVSGKPSYGVVKDDRYFFFASQDNMKKFQSTPEAFVDADLALGGECIVCRVDMNQRVPGSPEVAVTHKGIRYQFPGEEQKAMFMKSPARYVSAQQGMRASGPAGNQTRPWSATSQPTGGSGSR